MDASENQLRVGQVVNCLCGACDKHGRFGGRERGGRNRELGVTAGECGRVCVEGEGTGGRRR